VSAKELRLGRTLDASFKFVARNLLAFVRVGWLPISLMLALLALIGWTFLQPILLTYMEFIEAFAEVGDDPADVQRAVDNFSLAMEAAFESVGALNLWLGYLGIVIVSMLGTAIPMTAFIRMLALGETFHGLVYFRLGRRELNVAISYFLAALIATSAIMIVSTAIALISAMIFGGAGGGLIAVLLILGSLIVFFWVFARLVIAVPAAALDGGVSLMQTWAATRGYGGKIASILVVGYLMLLVISTVTMFILAGATNLVDGVLVSMGSNLSAYFSGGIWFVGYLAVTSISNAFFVSLFTVPYMTLKAQNAR